LRYIKNQEPITGKQNSHEEAVNFDRQPFAAIQSFPVIQNCRTHLTGDEEVPKKETLGAGDATF